MKKKKSQAAKMIQFKCTLLSFLNGLYIIIFFYIWSNSEGWWALRLVVCIHYPTWHPNLIQIKSFLDSRLCYEYQSVPCQYRVWTIPLSGLDKKFGRKINLYIYSLACVCTHAGTSTWDFLLAQYLQYFSCEFCRIRS